MHGVDLATQSFAEAQRLSDLHQFYDWSKPKKKKPKETKGK